MTFINDPNVWPKDFTHETPLPLWGHFDFKIYDGSDATLVKMGKVLHLFTDECDGRFGTACGYALQKKDKIGAPPEGTPKCENCLAYIECLAAFEGMITKEAAP